MTRRRMIVPGALLLLVVLALTAVSAPLAAAKAQKGTPELINVNTANLEELVTLPGIGESYALRLIEYRKKYGPFERVEDLLNVRGIGDRTLDRIRSRVTVGGK